MRTESRRTKSRGHRTPLPAPHDVHTHMLEHSVEESLALALATLDDPRLDDVSLEGVVLEGATLVATVRVPPTEVGPAAVALDRASAYLRRELSSDIHRKRVPNLRFVVLPTP